MAVVLVPHLGACTRGLHPVEDSSRRLRSPSLIGVLARRERCSARVRPHTPSRGPPGPSGPWPEPRGRTSATWAASPPPSPASGLLGLGIVLVRKKVGRVELVATPHRCGVGGARAVAALAIVLASAWCWLCFPWCSGLSRPIGSSTPRRGPFPPGTTPWISPPDGRGGAVRLVPPLAGTAPPSSWCPARVAPVTRSEPMRTSWSSTATASSPSMPRSRGEHGRPERLRLGVAAPMCVGGVRFLSSQARRPALPHRCDRPVDRGRRAHRDRTRSAGQRRGHVVGDRARRGDRSRCR